MFSQYMVLFCEFCFQKEVLPWFIISHVGTVLINKTQTAPELEPVVWREVVLHLDFINAAALPSSGAEESPHFKNLPDSDGFWECKAEGTLTIKRLSSTGTFAVCKGLKQKNISTVSITWIYLI